MTGRKLKTFVIYCFEDKFKLLEIIKRKTINSAIAIAKLRYRKIEYGEQQKYGILVFETEEKALEAIKLYSLEDPTDEERKTFKKELEERKLGESYTFEDMLNDEESEDIPSIELLKQIQFELQTFRYEMRNELQIFENKLITKMENNKQQILNAIGAIRRN